jgi:hypothetical protein
MPLALTQYFTRDSSLYPGIKVSASPLSSHSDSGEVCVFEAYLQFAFATTCCFASPLSEQTGLASGHRGRLLPGSRRLGHPHRRRISLQCQLGNLHWRDFHPLDHQLASLHYPGAQKSNC